MFDTHAHLDFYDNHDEVIKECFLNNVTNINTISVDISKYKHIRDIALKYKKINWSIGQHPCYVKNQNDIYSPEFIMNIINNESKIIGIGETGLDRIDLIESAFKQRQIESFNNHIQVSQVSRKPLIIHNRQSSKEIMNELNVYKSSTLQGVIHCFTGDLNFLKQSLNLGFYISISGIVTFKNAQDLRKLIKYIPIDRLLVETDSPYLTPEPIRNQKINKPKNITHTISKISEILNIDYQNIVNITIKNGLNAFQLSSLKIK